MGMGKYSIGGIALLEFLSSLFVLINNSGGGVSVSGERRAEWMVSFSRTRISYLPPSPSLLRDETELLIIPETKWRMTRRELGAEAKTTSTTAFTLGEKSRKRRGTSEVIDGLVEWRHGMSVRTKTSQ